MSEPVVSVVVPARAAPPTLAATLSGLAAQRLEEPYEVVVVADGSADATTEIARASPGEIRVVETPHGGVAEARNAGVAAARAGAIAFTDADCVPTPGWLAAGLSALESADLVQGAVTPDPTVGLGPFDRTLWVSRETGTYETANLFVRREAFERVGGFRPLVDTGEGRPFGEDSLFAWRLRRAGGRTAFAPVALVHHAVTKAGPVAYVRERARMRHFAALARAVPEVRRTHFFARVFLSRRTATFDLALVGALASRAARRSWPLALALPYLRLLLGRALEWGRPAPRVGFEVVLVDPAADVVGFAALAWGSLTRRCLVL